MNSEEKTHKIRQVSRIWSIVIICITLFIIISSIFFPDPYAVSYPPEENLMPLAMVISVFGLLIAWRWELIGGIINVTFFCINFLIFWIIRGEPLPFFVVFMLSPMVIPGFLFIFCWVRDKNYF